jgi:hypothetical protein
MMIIRNGDAFNLYSTISDAPIFKSAITEAELTAYIKDELGNAGIRALPERLQRTKESGTSRRFGGDLENEVSCNRSGENESCLTLQEFVAEYLSFPSPPKEVIHGTLSENIKCRGTLRPHKKLDERETRYKCEICKCTVSGLLIMKILNGDDV